MLILPSRWQDGAESLASAIYNMPLAYYSLHRGRQLLRQARQHVRYWGIAPGDHRLPRRSTLRHAAGGSLSKRLLASQRGRSLCHGCALGAGSGNTSGKFFNVIQSKPVLFYFLIVSWNEIALSKTHQRTIRPVVDVIKLKLKQQ